MANKYPKTITVDGEKYDINSVEEEESIRQQSKEDNEEVDIDDNLPQDSADNEEVDPPQENQQKNIKFVEFESVKVKSQRLNGKPGKVILKYDLITGRYK